MRLDNRPQPMRELLTEHPHIEREKVWPKWLLDEEKGIGTFQVGGSERARIRLQRFHAIWRFALVRSEQSKCNGYKILYNGMDYYFSPQTNVLYRRIGNMKANDKRIQPAIHLLIKSMD